MLSIESTPTGAPCGARRHRVADAVLEHALGDVGSCEEDLGHRDEVLLDVAEKSAASLFNVGSRGRGGVAGPLVGSVPATLAQRPPALAYASMPQSRQAGAGRGVLIHCSPS
ncbi:MAG: universal stress protein [Solirubrobacteraceae bacterium]